jgi:hypothetical protein
MLQLQKVDSLHSRRWKGRSADHHARVDVVRLDQVNQRLLEQHFLYFREILLPVGLLLAGAEPVT